MKTKEFLGINQPSQAIFAMCDGIEDALARSDFRIDMDTFGRTENNICCGCAATCTLQKLSDLKFNQATIYGAVARFTAILNKKESSLSWDDFDNLDRHMSFEQAIDALRGCNFHPIFDFFGYVGLGDNYQLLMKFKAAKKDLNNAEDCKRKLLDWRELAEKLQTNGF